MYHLITPHSQYELNHLEAVKREMQHRGVATLKAYRDHNQLTLLEGTHRTIAAYQLKCPLNIIECGEDDVITHDFQDIASPAKVWEILNYLSHSMHTLGLSFDEEDINFVGA